MHTPTKASIAVYDSCFLYSRGLAAVLRHNELQFFVDFMDVHHDLHSLELMIAENPPRILIYIINNKIYEDLRAIEKIKLSLPQCTVIAIGAKDKVGFVRIVLKVADIYIPKSITCDEIIGVVRSVIETGFYASNIMSLAILQQSRDTSNSVLTDKHLEIIRLACEEGWTSKEVGKALHLSPRTIESTKEGMQSRVGARSFIGVVTYAVKHNLI